MQLYRDVLNKTGMCQSRVHGCDAVYCTSNLMPRYIARRMICQSHSPVPIISTTQIGSTSKAYEATYTAVSIVYTRIGCHQRQFDNICSRR